MKVLVYKVSGGLNHMITQINRAVFASGLSGRHLIIDTYGGAFCNDFNKYFIIPGVEYSTNYHLLDNEKYKGFIENDAQYQKGIYYLEGETLNLRLNNVINDKPVIFCSMIACPDHEYVKVRKSVTDTIANPIKEKYIGVHFRNTDRKNNINDFVREINKIPCNLVYLATDDYSAFENLKTLTDKKVIQYTKPPDFGGQRVHYNHPDVDQCIMDSLTDMYYLIHATYFIPSVPSGFSKRVIKNRENYKFFI